MKKYRIYINRTDTFTGDFVVEAETYQQACIKAEGIANDIPTCDDSIWCYEDSESEATTGDRLDDEGNVIEFEEGDD